MDQYNFLKQLSYRIFFKKNVPSSSLKSVRVENKIGGLGGWIAELSLKSMTC